MRKPVMVLYGRFVLLMLIVTTNEYKNLMLNVHKNQFDVNYLGTIEIRYTLVAPMK